jgi:hypothetical protein
MQTKQKADKEIAKIEKEETLLAFFFSVSRSIQREQKGKWK